MIFRSAFPHIDVASGLDAIAVASLIRSLGDAAEEDAGVDVEVEVVLLDSAVVDVEDTGFLFPVDVAILVLESAVDVTVEGTIGNSDDSGAGTDTVGLLGGLEAGNEEIVSVWLVKAVLDGMTVWLLKSTLDGMLGLTVGV